ncbi:MAG TPA: alpha-hydroxy acid oxidase [Ktedonobacterales bacterium]|nr:alpha-hydroxy acid oxidase [Ktedonobacterales bacterium]
MEPINLFEYEALARTRMEPTAWDYYQSGAEDEVTLRENRAAFERIKLRPRMLRGSDACDTSVKLLDETLSLPVLVAPTAYQKLAHPEGEAAMARGAGAAGTIMAVSTLATTSLEEVADAATGPLWFQLYVYKDRAVTESLVRRAEAAGFKALVLTVDAPTLGRRERDIRNGFGLPPGLIVANFAGQALADQPGMDPGQSGLAVYAANMIDPTLTWESVEWLRSITRLPVLVKGILTAEDAREATALGVAGIIVSNHGGRQLDGAVAAIEALPEIVETVARRALTLVDGGIRRGTDVLKALALGADATLIGRPALWALAANGAAGVERALGLLREELGLAMTLAGCKSVAEVSRALVRLPAGW